MRRGRESLCRGQRRPGSPWAGALLTVALVLAPAAARAGGLRWDERWPRFGLGEALATVGLSVGVYFSETRDPGPTRGFGPGGFLFDDAVRDTLRARSRPSLDRARGASDKVWRLMLMVPPLVDLWVLGLGVHGSPDVTGQMALLTLQSYAFTGTMTLVTQLVARRERPYMQDCGEDGRGPLQDCGRPRDRESFLSGHSASAMTSAALSCLHHRRLGLLGGGAPELAWCGLLTSGALAADLLRIASDQHYASDVLAGLGLGVLAGYVLPAWLHYGFGTGRTGPPAHPGWRWTLAPGVAGGAPGLTLAGCGP